MMDKRQLFIVSRTALVATLSLLLFFQTSGCFNDPFEGQKKPNQPPDIWVTSGPPEGSVSSYKVHFYWHGWDPDGDVRYFEYAITDNENGAFDPADTTGRDKWERTDANDLTFNFTADQVEDSSDVTPPLEPINFIRSHTFFIRAVDDKGAASTHPAYRSFTARTLSPTVDILVPPYDGLNPARIPVIMTFRWTATDFIDDLYSKQDPDYIRWILVRRDRFNDSFEETIEYIRKHPDAPEWSEWQDYKAPDDKGKYWTTPPLHWGAYVFAVQAMDEAGAVTPVFDEVRNVRRVIVGETWGPILTVCNDYLGCMTSAVPLVDPVIADFLAGVPISFRLKIDSRVVAPTFYRYGWDMEDLGVDSLWSTDWTPYPGGWVDTPEFRYFFGTHTFCVEASLSGFISRICYKINVIPFTGERNLLVVDDYDEGDPRTSGWHVTNGAMPNDEEHDAFWVDVLQNVDGLNPDLDFIEVSSSLPLSIVKLTQYKAVIWDTFCGHALLPSKLPHLYDLIKFVPEDVTITVPGKIYPNLLSLYLAAGGHLLICGEQPMTAVLNRTYVYMPRFPFIFKYELLGDQDGDYSDQGDDPTGDNSFAYREMCLDVLDIAYPSAIIIIPPDLCNRHSHSQRPREDGLREGLPIDPNFPALTLRHEAAGPGRFYAPESRGLNNELYNPPYFTCGKLDLGPRSCFEPIYGHGCFDLTSLIYGAPIAAWTSVFENVIPDFPGGVAARSAIWGFEPVFFEPAAAREAMEVILFDEWQLPMK